MNYSKIKKIIEPFFELNNAVFLLALVIAVSLIWNTISAIEKNFSLQSKVDTMNQDLELSELENRNLELNNEYYKTDDYLELAARDKLNKVAPGEKVLVLPDYSDLETADQQAKTQAEAEETQPTSNLDEWLYFLFRRPPG